jgi:hypothetical protein
MAGFEVIIYGRFWVITEVKFPYLTIWYAAGLLSFRIPLLLRRERGGAEGSVVGALIALLSIEGQLAMANALNAGLARSVVFPLTIGGSILIVAVAGQLSL